MSFSDCGASRAPCGAVFSRRNSSSYSICALWLLSHFEAPDAHISVAPVVDERLCCPDGHYVPTINDRCVGEVMLDNLY
ncbi:unnamed protein product [Toxocara canis]|uniref:Secreted protein n=1 Tax=Toxocara canis TaxID=6265 RepID=A0A183V794_TOXCA|nr:unnamed protein product [Toxocara canis]